MSNPKKRTYQSGARKARAEQTRTRILAIAKNLFEKEGFHAVTIEKIARSADVSVPTIYSLFQSKWGVLRVLMDEVLPKHQFDALVEMSIQEQSAEMRLRISAKIARQIYEAESAQMEVFRDAAVLAPELKELEKEKELRRHERQEVTIAAMVKEGSLAKDLSAKKARDILWALTGRDMYRMLVLKQGWTSDEYEEWLGQILIKSLVLK